MIKNKKGIIFGIANDHSIAWGIAKKLHENGAKLAITYQNETLFKRVKPLADKVDSELLLECDFSKDNALETTFNEISNIWQNLDFIIHAVAYSDKNELNGRYVDTSKDNFICGSANIFNLDKKAKDCNILLKTIENKKIKNIMSNSFGFGGTNATLIFSKFND